MRGDTAIIIPAILIFSIPILAIFCNFVLKALKILKGEGKNGPKVEEEETELIQQIHQGLTRMEERVEALETILLDREFRQKE